MSVDRFILNLFLVPEPKVALGLLFFLLLGIFPIIVVLFSLANDLPIYITVFLQFLLFVFLQSVPQEFVVIREIMDYLFQLNQLLVSRVTGIHFFFSQNISDTPNARTNF